MRFHFSLQCKHCQAYLAVVENLVHGFRNKEDLSTVTPNHKQETISSLHYPTQKTLE